MAVGPGSEEVSRLSKQEAEESLLFVAVSSAIASHILLLLLLPQGSRPRHRVSVESDAKGKKGWFFLRRKKGTPHRSRLSSQQVKVDTIKSINHAKRGDYFRGREKDEARAAA